jgi:hypothetical protein
VPGPVAGARRYLTWCDREGRRVVRLVADDAGLEGLKKQEAERLDREVAAEGVAGRVESIEGTEVHFLVYATHWAQAGRLKEGQAVRLAATGPSPLASPTAARPPCRPPRTASTPCRRAGPRSGWRRRRS